MHEGANKLPHADSGLTEVDVRKDTPSKGGKLGWCSVRVRWSGTAILFRYFSLEEQALSSAPVNPLGRTKIQESA